MKPGEETEVVNVSGVLLEANVEPPVGEEDSVEPPGFGNLAFFLKTKSSMLPEKSSLM